MGKEITTELLESLNQYLQGTLSAEQQQNFESELSNNAALQEELIIQKNLIQALNKDSKDWNIYKKEDTDDRFDEIKKGFESEAIQDISNKIKSTGRDFVPRNSRPIPKRRFNRVFLLAAGITLLVLAIILLIQTMETSSESELYQRYADWNSELPSFSEKSSDTGLLLNAEKAFKNKDYQEVIKVLENVEVNDANYPFALMYSGAAYHKLDQNDKAAKQFKSLNELTNLPEHSKGLWFELLIYMKADDSIKMKAVLSKILDNENNYHYEDAKKILQELE